MFDIQWTEPSSLSFVLMYIIILSSKWQGADIKNVIVYINEGGGI